MLSWEYPPVVAGGLGRHVCALAEHLAAAGDAVDVVTRGRDTDPAAEIRGGVRVHRLAAPPMPHDLDAFLAWVDALNGAWSRRRRRSPARARPTWSTGTTGSSPRPRRPSPTASGRRT